MIVYGGTEIQIKQQKLCQHEWHGPCRDNIGHFYKCKMCFCLEREEVGFELAEKLVSKNLTEAVQGYFDQKK